MNAFLKKVLKSFYLVFFFSSFLLSTEARGEIDSVFPFIPDLKECRNIINANQNILDKGEAIFAAKNYFFQIQSKAEQLNISKEVRTHFETAIEKAEQKYDEGEEDVSQSDITKLKLGLAGTLNDIYELTEEIQIAKLSLGHLLGVMFTEKSSIQDDKMIVLEFSSQNRDDIGSLKSENQLEAEKQLAHIFKAEKVFKLAKKNRKITRSLLVTEVANYDFGIGNSGDLFEALIIYTRVLRGYYQAMYDFNHSVIKMELLRFKSKSSQ